MITKIKTINDVKAFATHLVQVEKLSFHPDDDFKDYITSDMKSFYSEQEAEFRNKLMTDCFEVCNNKNVEIYKLLLPIIQKSFLAQLR